MKDRQFSDHDKGVLLKKFKQSGIAVSRFCLQEGISQSLLRNWLRESEGSGLRPGRFVSLQFVEVEGRLFPLVMD